MPLGARERGITLVELMIALLLGLMLTGGIIQVFLANRTTYAFTDGLSRIQENARFALDHIARSARMAGYVGCLSSVPVNNNLAATSNFRDDLVGGLQGYEAEGTGNGDTYAAGAIDPAPGTDPTDWDPALPAELDDLVIPGSDVLVVRHVGSDSNTLISPFSNADQLFTTQPDGFLPGQVLVVTDCQKATLFQVTNDTGTDAFLAHTSGGFTPDNNAALAAWPAEQSYGLGSEVAPLEATAFYVGLGANGTPALWQLRFQRRNGTTSDFFAEELVDGIDTMQLRYGLDGDNNGQVDDWQPAATGMDWGSVLGVEITLLARATEEYGLERDVAVHAVGGTTQFNPVDDRRLRQVFSTTIGLRNRLP
jgi:type IV pilus assembly protein PilW